MIEERYRAENDRLSPRERIARGVALFDWARAWIGRQIVAERGGMSRDRLRWEVALRLYGDEPGARRLIERALDGLGRDVPR
ncbi:MAG: hypothetical protein ACKOZU_10800 [Planctomycetaceae bacterium]